MILRGVPTKIRVLVTDSDGAALAVEEEKEAPEVSLTVTKDSDGSKVVEEVEAEYEADGVYVYELPAVASLDLLTATWEVAEEGGTFTTYEEVVGARICSLAQITDQISGESPTAETVRLARDVAERLLEDECGVAFRPRYKHETLDGSGTRRQILSQPKLSALRSVELEEETLEVGDPKTYPDSGVLWREESWTEGAQNVEVIYEHGYPSPPGQASRACALLARHIATKRPSNLDDRATSISTEEAAYSLITPGVRGMVTAIPEVNAFINAWQFPQVG